MSQHNFFDHALADLPASGKIGDPAIFAWGDTVPTDSDPGYKKGCIFVDTNGGSIAALLYLNVGTDAACDFDVLDNVAS